jgi:hypothetical protein
MTISSTTRRAGPFAGNNAATVFPFSFKIFTKTDVQVILTNASGATSTLTLDSDYSVSVSADQNGAPGGSITYPLSGALLPTGSNLVVLGALPYTQPTDLTNQGGFYPSVIEDALDRAEIQIQQLDEIATRSLSFPPAESVAGVLPAALQRAGTVLGFDSLGNPTFLPIPASVGAGDLRDELGSDGKPGLIVGTDVAVGATQIPLSRAPISKANVWVQFDSAWQGGDQIVSITGNLLTIVAPGVPNGISRVYIRTGTTLSLNTPAQGSVTDISVPAGANIDSSKISFLQAGAGALRRSVQSKLSDVYHVSDFGNNLSLAIDAVPDGGVLILGAGPYTANFTKSRSNITIRGAGRPSANAARTALVGGTVIQGMLVLDGNNITVEDLGVDCGGPVCNALNGGVAMNGLVIHDPTQVSIRTGVTVRNVSALCRSPTDLFHAVLLEGLQYVAFENIHGYQGFAGVVIKCQNGYARGLYGYHNSQIGVHPKSNSYAPCNRMVFDDLQADDEGLGVGVGVYIYAESAQMQDIVIGKIRVRGFDKGCAIFGAPGQVVNDISIGQIASEAPVSFGFVTNSPILQMQVGRIQVSNPVSGKAVQVNDDCAGILIGEIQTTSPAGKDMDDCVYLGGLFSVGKIVNTQQYGFTTTPGITVSPSAIFPRAWRITDYIGRLTLNAGAASLMNGWTTAFGDAPAAVYRNGRVSLSGRLAVPSTPWTGKEVCFQVDTRIAPLVQRVFFATGYMGSTSAPVPIYLEVNADGTVKVTFLNTPAQFPAGVLWISLNGISWSITE